MKNNALIVQNFAKSVINQLVKPAKKTIFFIKKNVYHPALKKHIL